MIESVLSFFLKLLGRAIDEEAESTSPALSGRLKFAKTWGLR